VSESIEVHVIAIPKESNAHYVTQNRSRRESSESGDREMDKARRGEQAGASESIEVRVNEFHQESQARNLGEAAFPAGIEPAFKV
jgi:hypothetical protein